MKQRRLQRFTGVANIFWSLCVCLYTVGMLIATPNVVRAATRPQEPDIQVRFDRQSFIAGEPFKVEISVTTQGQGEPQISVPSFSGMKVLRKNVTKPSSGYSFSFSFGTGQQTKRVVQNSGTTKYDLVLVAENAGKFTVGPIKVELDGFTFKGKSYPIEVFERGKTSAALADVASPSSNSVTEAQLEGARIDPDYFLHMIPSKTECTVGEQVVLDVYLFTSVNNIRADQFEKEPGTEGFWVERFEDFDLRNHRNRQVVINGILYEQVLLKKLALFPLKAGNLTIAPPIFSFVVGGGGFFSFARGKEVKRAASPVVIEVAPLPDANRPSGFGGANIGKYSFFVSANETNVKVGEPVTVTVSVRGTGNIRSVELPAFSEVEGFKMYAPETSVEVQARGGVVSGMSQSQTLFIPEKEGELTIPALTFDYFDLATKTYKTQNSNPLRIQVAKGKRRDAGGVVIDVSPKSSAKVSASVERMNAGMRTILYDTDISQKTTPVFQRTWYLLLVFGVPILFLGYLIAARIRKRAADNFSKGRSKRAESEAYKALGMLEKEHGLSNDQFFSRLHKILLNFLEDRLEENVVGDTMNQLSKRLEDRGIETSHCANVVAALEEYEFARFAKSEGDNSERKGDIQRAKTLVAQLGDVNITAKKGNPK